MPLFGLLPVTEYLRKGMNENSEEDLKTHGLLCRVRQIHKPSLLMEKEVHSTVEQVIRCS